MENRCGLQEAADATMEVAKTLNEKISKYCLVTIETCAYAGTGNVLKVVIHFFYVTCRIFFPL